MTLLEVILAVTLTVMLMGTVFWLYDRATSIRADVLRQAELTGQMRRLMEHLTTELRAAKPTNLFSGAIDSITFLNSRVPDGSAWTEPSLRQDPPPPQYDQQLLTYRLLKVLDEQNVEQNLGVERVVQKNPAQKLTDETEVPSVLVAPDIKFLRLRYWNGTDWSLSWSGRALPGAVEIALGQQPLEENQDPLEYSHEMYTRVVSLPMTAMQPTSAPAAVIGGTAP